MRDIWHLKASEEKQDFHDLIGTDVTFANDIITVMGYVSHVKGEKAYISDVIYDAGYYSKCCPDIWNEPKIRMFQINNVPGHWRIDTFLEYKSPQTKQL